MGRVSNKRRRTPKASKTHALDDDARLDDKIDDEIDAFHKQREMIPLDVYKDSEDSDDDAEEPVFDLEAYQNGRDDEEDDMDDEELTDVKDKGFAAKIARQAKYLKERFGGEDEISDDDKSDEERKTVWGRKKSMYYGADNIDYELQSSDEDLLMEEAEVIRIERERAKTLTKEDLGLETSDEEEDKFVGEKTFEDLAKKRATPKRGSNVVDGITLNDSEVIKKDLNALSKKEQMDLVHSSAPELVGLLSEMKMAYSEFKKMKPLVSEDFKLGEGANYFEVTYMMSLLYCLVISAYLILKSEGHSIRDHPVIAHILEIKIEWDKLLKMRSKFPLPVENSINHNSESITKSNVENRSLERKACLVDMPTKALTVQETAGFSKDVSKNSDRKDASKKQQVREMAGFAKDVSKNPDRKAASKKQQKPQELDPKRIEMLKVRENLEAKLKQNSSYSCLNLVADKTEKVIARPINGNLVTLDDYGDEPVDAKHRGSASGHQSLNKLMQTASTKKKGWKIISGDEDLPKRDDIAERRRKYELRVLAGAGLTDDGGESFDHGQGTHVAEACNNLQESGKIESEDESDREVKKRRTEKLPTKAQTPQVVREEPAFNGRRPIPREIEKNRGLTRYRKKLTKNPRKKYKIKHAKAVMRRKGQVRDIRRPTGSYGGEPTGININVSRSIRFKN